MTPRAEDRAPEFRIRWVLTHEPIALFEEAARAFVSGVAERTAGRVAVDVLTPSEHGSGRRAPAEEVMAACAAGDVEMSQTYTTVLGQVHEPLWMLDLPFLFDSHDHASQVLDGAIGRELLDGLRPHGLHGLAFTYSGGYRIVSTTDRRLERPEDLHGLHVRTSFNPVVMDFFESLGATPHPAALQAIPRLTNDGTIDAAESTWPRYWDMEHHRSQPVVNETGHSLFLTSLVMNARFWAGLPEDVREAIQATALDVARLERVKSVEDGRTARAASAAAGIVRCEPTAELTAALVETGRRVRDRFAPELGPDLVASIRAAALSAAG